MNTAVSLAPSDQTQGGSNFDDIDVEVASAKFVSRDFVNKAGEAVAKNVTCLEVIYRPMVEDGESKEFTEQ